MKILISQSGEKSRLAAQYLRDWLRCVIQSLDPWVSAIDIDAGDRWSVRVDQELEATNFGILCLTRTNTSAQWILFEAGALAKTTEGIHVCPYLIDLASSDVPEGPLTKFQAKGANENGTWELILAINKAMAGEALPEDHLRKSFDKWWPDLKARLESLPAEETAGTQVRPIGSILSTKYWRQCAICRVVRPTSRNVSQSMRVRCCSKPLPSSKRHKVFQTRRAT
jgi:hypothetical protein